MSTVYMGFKNAITTMQIKGSRLVKTHTNATPIGYVYHVLPGQSGGRAGQVSEEIAEKIKKHPQVSSSEDGLFTDMDIFLDNIVDAPNSRIGEP